MTQIATDANTSGSQPLARPAGARLGRGWAATVGRDLSYLTGTLGTSVLAWIGSMLGVTAALGSATLTIGSRVLLPSKSLSWIADLDRRLLSRYLGVPVTSGRPDPVEATSSRRRGATRPDRRAWAALRWLSVNATLGMTIAALGIGAVFEILALISTPLWWWALNDPHHQYGTLNLGLYTVTSTGWALLTTALGALLAPVGLAISHRLAAAHAARALKMLEEVGTGRPLNTLSV